MWSYKYQTGSLTFRLWYSYDLLTINILYIILLYRPIEQYLDRSRIISKLRLFTEDIEAFVYSWGWYIVGDMENGGQAAAEHMDGIFEAS